MRKTIIWLLALAAFGTTASAWAASDHRSAAQIRRPLYNVVPGYAGERCTASGGPACSSACLPSGPPCKTEPDGW
jgi:hypothetical protein